MATGLIIHGLVMIYWSLYSSNCTDVKTKQDLLYATLTTQIEWQIFGRKLHLLEQPL